MVCWKALIYESGALVMLISIKNSWVINKYNLPKELSSSKRIIRWKLLVAELSLLHLLNHFLLKKIEPMHKNLVAKANQLNVGNNILGKNIPRRNVPEKMFRCTGKIIRTFHIEKMSVKEISWTKGSNILTLLVGKMSPKKISKGVFGNTIGTFCLIAPLVIFILYSNIIEYRKLHTKIVVTA